MKLFEEWLAEANIKGLRNVKHLRHYTTLEALEKILKTGKLRPSSSVGDEDWDKCLKPFKYKRVVSFLDSRIDTEEEYLEEANNRIEEQSWTDHLALHLSDICVCIEVDYEAIEESLEKAPEVLNTFKSSIESFISDWNEEVRSYDSDYTYELLDKLEKRKEEIKKLISSREYQKTLDKFVREKFCTYNDMELVYNFFETLGPTHSEFDTSIIDWYAKHPAKEITSSEKDEFRKYAEELDALSLFKFMKKHNYTDRNIGKKSYDGKEIYNPIHFDNFLMSMFHSITRGKENRNSFVVNNMNIEVRVPCNVYLNKDNCKIYLYGGVLASDTLTSNDAQEKNLYWEGSMDEWEDFLNQSPKYRKAMKLRDLYKDKYDISVLLPE